MSVDLLDGCRVRRSCDGKKKSKPLTLNKCVFIQLSLSLNRLLGLLLSKSLKPYSNHLLRMGNESFESNRRDPSDHRSRRLSLLSEAVLNKKSLIKQKRKPTGFSVITTYSKRSSIS